MKNLIFFSQQKQLPLLFAEKHIDMYICKHQLGASKFFAFGAKANLFDSSCCKGYILRRKKAHLGLINGFQFH